MKNQSQQKKNRIACIGSDLAALSWCELSKGRGSSIKTWLSNFIGFFQLIDKRKTTQTHGLLPSGAGFASICLCFVVLVSLAHFFADPRYMDWFKVNNTDDPTSIYSLTTDLAKVDPYLIVSFVAILVISIWKSSPNSRAELVMWHHRFMGFYFIFTTIAFSGLLTLLFKHIFGRVRPNANDGSALWQSFPFEGGYDFLSFPSGHSTTAGAIAVIVTLFAPRLAVLGWAFALWIAISRLGVGAHYPADVIAGLAVGSIFTWIYARSFARKRLLFSFDTKGRLQFRKPYGSS